MVVIFKFNKNSGMKFFMVIAPRRSGDQTRMEVTNDDVTGKTFGKLESPHCISNETIPLYSTELAIEMG